MHSIRPPAVLIATLLAAFAPVASFADTVSTVPVHFGKNASSTAIAGSLRGYGTIHYTVDARAGQKMTVKVTGSTNANFNVLPVDAIAGDTTAIGSGFVGGDWSGTLPGDGTYTIEVYQMRASARRGATAAYTIQIGIEGSPQSAKPLGTPR